MPGTLTGTRRLEWLRRQRDNVASEVEALTNKAIDDDRDLTDAEQNSCEVRRSRLESLDNEISIEVDLCERSQRYEELSDRVSLPPSPSSQRDDQGHTVERSAPPVEYETPGEYLVDFLTRSEDANSARRFDQFWRAAPHQLVADNPGIVPTPIMGPLWNTINSRRPAIEATTKRPMPSAGRQFTRPHVTQHTLVDVQATEKTALTARQMKIDPLTVTKTTYGGYVNLSFQDRDWTDPAIMNILVGDLAAMYAQATDKAFCTAFPGLITQTAPLATNDGAGWLGAIYAACGLVYAADNALPDTIWVSTDVWGGLGALVDGSGRPLFPTVGPNNALGSIQPQTLGGSVAGMRLVVDANFPAKTCIIGDSSAVEFYEQVGGQVSAVEPSVLGTNIAYYGYAAWLVIEPNAFVKLTGVALPFSGDSESAKTETASK